MKASASINQPVVLSIAASDCCAGAGIQADLKTFSACGVYGLTAVTGIVAQNAHRVESWEAGSLSLLHDQLRCLVAQYPIAAVKTGLLFNEELVEGAAHYCRELGCPLIIDPVGTASAGATFHSPQARQAVVEHLFPLARLITPNLLEARALCDNPELSAAEASEQLARQYGVAFLVKGGHSHCPTEATDCYFDPIPETALVFSSPRIPAPDLHGTGCTLSAAIASFQALGSPLPEAISQAKKYMSRSIAHHLRWEFGPVAQSALHHFPPPETGEVDTA